MLSKDLGGGWVSLSGWEREGKVKEGCVLDCLLRHGQVDGAFVCRGLVGVVEQRPALLFWLGEGGAGGVGFVLGDVSQAEDLDREPFHAGVQQAQRRDGVAVLDDVAGFELLLLGRRHEEAGLLPEQAEIGRL